MSNPDFPGPPPPTLHQPRLIHPPAPLLKQRTWSPDSYREELWQRQKERRNRRRKSLTDEDLDELKACIDLGFGFESLDLDQRLSDTFPALGLYHAVQKQYYDTVSKSSSSSSPSPPGSPVGSPHAMFSLGDDPETVKARLRRWAQVVACSVRQSRLDNGRC